jgi:hypothetical protein
MKISSIPKSGRQDSVVFVNSRFGKVARAFTPPSNPRTAEQQAHCRNVHVVSSRWRRLVPEQRAAWYAAVAHQYRVTKTDRRIRRSPYNLYRSLNVRRADLGLPYLDLPTAKPVFARTPVEELVVINAGDRVIVKLRLSSPPAQDILVYRAAPVRTGVRCVQHFPLLGLLPSATNGWSDITELYVARYGVPKPGTAIWIRTCQYIDGWTDAPKEFRFRVEAPTT